MAELVNFKPGLGFKDPERFEPFLRCDKAADERFGNQKLLALGPTELTVTYNLASSILLTLHSGTPLDKRYVELIGIHDFVVNQSHTHV